MSEENEKDDFYEEVKQDMDIDQYNLIDGARNVTNILQKYTDRLRSESRKMNKVKIVMDQTLHEQFIYYTTEHEIRFNPSDARRMAETCPKMLKIRAIFNKCEENTKYLTNIMWNLREKTKNIRNIIDVKKFEMG